MNYALHAAVAHLEKEGFDAAMTVVTNADSDTVFHPRYLEALTYHFMDSGDREGCLYQVWLTYVKKITLDCLCDLRRCSTTSGESTSALCAKKLIRSLWQPCIGSIFFRANP